MLVDVIKGKAYEVVPVSFIRTGENSGTLTCQVKHGKLVGTISTRDTFDLQKFIERFPAMKEEVPESDAATDAATDPTGTGSTPVTEELSDSGETPKKKRSRKRK